MSVLRSPLPLLLGAFVYLVSVFPLIAQGQPLGPVILTVTGEIENPNLGSDMAYDLEMLESLGAVEIKTETAWLNNYH